MELNDLLDLLVEERVAAFCREYKMARVEATSQYEEWIQKLKEKAPELVEEYEDYEERMALSQDMDQAELYKFGVADGIKIMKYILKIGGHEDGK